MSEKKDGPVYNLLPVSSGVLLFLGGLGIETSIVKYTGLIFGILTLLIVYLEKNGKIRWPRGILFYIVFLLTFLTSVLWSEWKEIALEHLVMFLAGGLFWVAFYNFGKKLSKGFLKVIIILAVVFGAIFLVYKLLFKPIPFRIWSLYLPTTNVRNHNHLGDLWAVVLVLIGYLITSKKRWWHWLILGAGFYFLAQSFSRSALTALLTGIGFLYLRMKKIKVNRSIFAFLLGTCALLFLYSGLYKSTFSARPYFGQTLRGVLQYPLGVGVGNFTAISIATTTDIHKFSSLAHNIVLEFIAGMGVLGLSFLFWLVYVLQDFFKNKSSKAISFQAVFLAITANFFFDYTYFIPTMLWLWFMVLGLSKSGSEGKMPRTQT